MSGRNIKLQDLRTEKNWTLRAAAQHIGVTKTVLFNAEQGVLPRVDHAIQIAGQYNRSVEDLWAPLSCVQPLGPPSAQHDAPSKRCGQDFTMSATRNQTGFGFKLQMRSQRSHQLLAVCPNIAPFAMCGFRVVLSRESTTIMLSLSVRVRRGLTHSQKADEWSIRASSDRLR